MMNQTKTLIIAHRGASSEAPENTMRAFRRAVELSADGIELDVRMTKDNVVVVLHDEDVDRVSDGTGLVSDMTYAELQGLNFGALYADEPVERIPRLRDVISLLEPTELMLNVEIKQSGIEEAVLSEVAPLGSRVIFSSFDHYSMRRIKKLDPGARIGLLYSEILFKPWRYARDLGAEAIHPHYRSLLLPGIVRKCRERGIDVNAWTVDDGDIMRKLIKKGVSALITNQVERALKVRETH